MHIAYLIGSSSWGGLEMNQVKNARWMMEAGNQVTVLGTENPRVIQFCTEHQIPFRKIDSHKKYYDFKASRKLRNLLKELQVEHVIIRDVRDMSVSALAKFWSKKAFKLHYFMEMQLGVSKKNPLHTLRFKQLNTWSCPLNWLHEQVLSMTKMNPEKVITLPSPFDPKPFQSTLNQQDARLNMDLPENVFLVGLAGRFDIQKGQLLLLDAVENNPNKAIHVVLLGEPTHNEGDEYARLLQEKIATPELKNRVFIRPFRSDIETFYRAIDVFVMASKAETVGMVTLEALASGCLVIGSNAGGTPEILGEGKRGLLFTPLDSNSLNEKLTEAYENQQAISKEDMLNYVSDFDYRKVIPQVIERLKNA